MFNDNCPPPSGRAYTYIIRCSDGTLYCGWTNDLTSRLAAHNSGKGAKYTKGRGPVTLVYSELYDSQSDAMKREAAIKKLSRDEKETLILSQKGGEPLTVYDSNGCPCGERPREIVHLQGLFHHVCHLWVCGVWDGVPGIWLQQRQLDRPLYPGCFDLASTGHIDPGETPETAILREAGEEIGLMSGLPSLTPLPPCRQRYARQNDGGFDDELAYPFILRIDGIPPFSPGSEVMGMAFASLSDFANAHTGEAPLTARKTDGSVFSIPHDRLCCLHQEEWEHARPILEKEFQNKLVLPVP